MDEMKDKMNDIKNKMMNGNGSEDMMMDKHNKHHKERETKDLSMDKLKKIFLENFSDEIEDSNKYMDMAMFAKEMGNDKLAKGLMEISHDEYTHAKFLHYNLLSWGCQIPSDDLMQWQELKDRLKQVFRS